LSRFFQEFLQQVDFFQKLTSAFFSSLLLLQKMNTLHTVFFKISDFFTPHYIYRWFTPNSSFSPHFLLTAIPEEIPDFQEKSSTVSTFSRNLQFTSIKSYLLSSQTVNRGLVFRVFSRTRSFSCATLASSFFISSSSFLLSQSSIILNSLLNFVFQTPHLVLNFRAKSSIMPTLHSTSDSLLLHHFFYLH
jgi:hypothetical protein